MSVNPAQVEREQFVSIQTCFICYQFEDHATKDCPDATARHCPECARHGHTWSECKATYKQCLNYTKRGFQNQGHRTLAMSCPIKKQIMAKKREEVK